MSATAPAVRSVKKSSYQELSHVELVRVCVDTGSDLAWNEFAARYNRFICLAVLRAYCQRGGRRTGSVDVELINDLVQDVYLKLYESTRGTLQMFRGANDAAVFVYIGRVAISVVIDHLRRNGARKRGTETVSLDALLPSDDGQEVTLGDCVPAPGASPEQEACASVLRSEVSEILSRVLRGRNAARDLRIAEACIFEGSSLAEVSESLGGIRESGVKSSVRRTSIRLRSELGRLERQAASRLSRYATR